jgi:polysaccharide deacetylase family protein (PEP-CTERM system associated)
MQNILTIDVEEWYHGNDFDLPRQRQLTLPSRVERQTDVLIEMLARRGARATFFILGCVAEAYPDLVRRIHAAGHEVASHSFYHDLVYKLSPEQFESQLRRCAELPHHITGEPIQSFRAPSWSIVETNLWAMEVIRRCGLTCDASIFPMRTGMFGIKNARLDIHQVAPSDATGLALTEYPPAALRFAGMTLPFAGGIFFRLLPYQVSRRALASMNARGRPGVVYLHPWELDPDQPRLPDLPARRTWYHYYGLGAARAKYERLLGDFQFGSIRDHRTGKAA